MAIVDTSAGQANKLNSSEIEKINPIIAPDSLKFFIKSQHIFRDPANDFYNYLIISDTKLHSLKINESNRVVLDSVHSCNLNDIREIEFQDYFQDDPKAKTIGTRIKNLPIGEFLIVSEAVYSGMGDKDKLSLFISELKRLVPTINLYQCYSNYNMPRTLIEKI